MKKAFLIGSIFACSSMFAIEVSSPSSRVAPSPDSQSSTSPLNAPSLTDPSAKPITPPTTPTPNPTPGPAKP